LKSFTRFVVYTGACIYSRLPEDEPSGSKHVEHIKN